MLKLKRSDEQKIKLKEQEWESVVRPVNLFWKEIIRTIKYFMKWLMYYKPTDKLDRQVHSFEWWFCLAVIFFAFKGFTYWLTGR